MTEIEARKWAIETLLNNKFDVAGNDVNLLINKLTDSGRIKFEDTN